jgi:hypothetical protein
MQATPQPLAISEDQRRTILGVANDMPPHVRERFLGAIVDELQGRNLTNAEVCGVVSVVRRRMLGMR